MLIAFGIALAIAVAFASTAIADDAPPPPPPTLQALEEAPSYDRGMHDFAPQLTDSEAAEELPLEDIGREEALQALQQIFGAQIQEPGGFFGDLEVERFYSNYVAEVQAGDKTVLLDSTLPLRAPGILGAEEQVDLGLERAEGEITPANPLAPVSIPAQLGDGIELPESGLRISLAGAPADRTASIAEGAAAVYPNVAEDTDFAVAPTPTGLETLTQIRSSDAPQSETLELTLPDGASLEATGDGGAAVTKDGETLVGVQPATAIDATGANVPVSVSVGASSLTYTVEPGANVSYPILLDPVVQEYLWGNGNTQGIGDWAYSGGSTPMFGSTKAECSTWCAGYLENNKPGLWLVSYASLANHNPSMVGFNYFIPRWNSDWTTYGEGPKSYISKATYYGVVFQHRSDTNASPYLVGGLYYPEGGSYTTSFSRAGYEANLATTSTPYVFNGTNTSKQAVFGLLSSDAHTLNSNRDAYLGWTTVELTDVNHPKGAAGGTAPQWVNNSPSSVIPFEFNDTGLGVSSITLSDKSGHSWKTSLSCTGATGNPCPRKWSSTGGQPQLNYDPSVLPQGTDTLEMVARDPLGQANNEKTGEEAAEARNVQVKVDHTAPTLALSGTMTEQATLGTTLPQYTLKYVAKDGSEASAQSGVASVEVKIDGAKVEAASQSPGCTTKNCELTKEWTLEASSYSTGSHSVEVVANDAVGISTTQKLTISLGADETAPALTLSGQIPSAPEGWVEQKSYSLTASATDAKGYGVKSLQYKVDGTVKATYNAASCPAGGCPASKTWTVNAAEFGGGAHQVEVIAYDYAGSGNKAVTTITMNVDPQGGITTAEATATLKAVESTVAERTEGSTLIAPAAEVIPVQEREEGNDPSLVIKGSAIESTGTPVQTSLTADPKDGIEIEGSETAIEVTPTSSAGGSTQVTAGIAGLTSNAQANVDTIVRPKFNGTLLFQLLRDKSAPETYSWEVGLEEGQRLEAIDNRFAAVYFENGELAALIAAEVAHDAAGAEVPTSLGVSGKNVLNLTVHHHEGSYVYPIHAGPAFELGYTAVVDPNRKDLSEQEEEEIQGGSDGGYFAGPPEPGAPESGPYASMSSGWNRTWNVHYHECSAFEIPIIEVGGCEAWERDMKVHFHYNGDVAWWNPKQVHPNCTEAYSVSQVTQSLEYCDWIGPNYQKFGAGYHISAQVALNVVATVPLIGWSHQGFPKGTAYIYGDGYYSPLHQTGSICNPLSSC